METGINLTGYDFVILGIAALLVARGVWLGLLKQVIGLLSLLIGYYVASQYHDRLFPFLKDVSDNPKVVFVASVVILFVVTYLAALLLGKLLSRVVEIVISKWFDKLLGAVMGGGLAVIVVVLLHMILGSVLSPENSMLKECRTCDGLNRATDFARTVIRDEEVRKSLMQQSPAITTKELLDFFQDQQNGGEEQGETTSSAVVE